MPQYTALFVPGVHRESEVAWRDKVALPSEVKRPVFIAIHYLHCIRIDFQQGIEDLVRALLLVNASQERTK